HSPQRFFLRIAFDGTVRPHTLHLMRRRLPPPILAATAPARTSRLERGIDTSEVHRVRQGHARVTIVRSPATVSWRKMPFDHNEYCKTDVGTIRRAARAANPSTRPSRHGERFHDAFVNDDAVSAGVGGHMRVSGVMKFRIAIELENDRSDL